MRTIVYIDGYNFYYGCCRQSRHKWINLRRLMEKLLPAPHDRESSRIRAGFLATKERKEDKDSAFRPAFFAISEFFRGYTSG